MLNFITVPIRILGNICSLSFSIKYLDFVWRGLTISSWIIKKNKISLICQLLNLGTCFAPYIQQKRIKT